MIDNRPIYLQIADRLMDDILAGRYAPDSRVPSVRELAAQAQVNVNTLLRAYEQLERDGIIYNKRGLGYFVSADAASRIRERHRQQFFTGEIEFFFRRLKSLQITPAELAKLYERYLGDNP